MRWVTGLVTGVLAGLVAGGAARAQDNTPPPGSCGETYIKLRGWEQCLKDAEPGSVIGMLAAANLGTEALFEGDLGDAVRYYDMTKPEGGEVYSDILLHAYRAYAFDRVGRTEDALADARTVLTYVDQGMFAPDGTRLNDDAKAFALGMVLETLWRGEDLRFEEALETYLDLPLSDPIGIIDRAGVLIEVRRFDLALADANEAVLTFPDIAASWNNRCYLFDLMEQYEDALLDCDRAIALEPDNAAILHSRAVALAGLGRCEEAEADIARARELDPANATLQEPIACTPAP